MTQLLHQACGALCSSHVSGMLVTASPDSRPNFTEHETFSNRVELRLQSGVDLSFLWSRLPCGFGASMCFDSFFWDLWRFQKG